MKEHLASILLLFEYAQLHHIEQSKFNNEGDDGMFLHYEEKVAIPNFQDSFTSLLDS